MTGMSDSDDEPSWFQADEQPAYETGSRIQTLLGDTGSVRRETRENYKNKSSFVEPLINPVSPDIVESGGTEEEQFQTIVFNLDAITQMVEYQPARWIPPPEKAPTFPEECRASFPLSLTENPILLLRGSPSVLVMKMSCHMTNDSLKKSLLHWLLTLATTRLESTDDLSGVMINGAAFSSLYQLIAPRLKGHPWMHAFYREDIAASLLSDSSAAVLLDCGAFRRAFSAAGSNWLSYPMKELLCISYQGIPLEYLTSWGLMDAHPEMDTCLAHALRILSFQIINNHPACMEWLSHALKHEHSQVVGLTLDLFGSILTVAAPLWLEYQLVLTRYLKMLEDCFDDSREKKAFQKSLVQTIIEVASQHGLSLWIARLSQTPAAFHPLTAQLVLELLSRYYFMQPVLSLEGCLRLLRSHLSVRKSRIRWYAEFRTNSWLREVICLLNWVVPLQNFVHPDSPIAKNPADCVSVQAWIQWTEQISRSIVAKNAEATALKIMLESFRRRRLLLAQQRQVSGDSIL